MRFPFNGIAASLLALGLAACGNSAEQNSTSAPAASQPIAASQPAATGVSRWRNLLLKYGPPAKAARPMPVSKTAAR